MYSYIQNFLNFTIYHFLTLPTLELTSMYTVGEGQSLSFLRFLLRCGLITTWLSSTESYPGLQKSKRFIPSKLNHRAQKWSKALCRTCSRPTVPWDTISTRWVMKKKLCRLCQKDEKTSLRILWEYEAEASKGIWYFKGCFEIRGNSIN